MRESIWKLFGASTANLTLRYTSAMAVTKNSSELNVSGFVPRKPAGSEASWRAYPPRFRDCRPGKPCFNWRPPANNRLQPSAAGAIIDRRG
jgi:hypothetical protein